MSSFKLVAFGLIGAFLALLVVAAANSHRRWVYWLFGYSVGPRTDVKNLTKQQLWSSAWRFMCWGLVCLLGLVALVALPQFSGWGPGAPVETVALALVLFLLTGLGLVGGLYLLVRCVFRSSNYVAP